METKSNEVCIKVAHYTICDVPGDVVDADRVPDARHPVREQHEHDDEQQEHRAAELEVHVHFAHDAAETQQAEDLQGAEQLRHVRLRVSRDLRLIHEQQREQLVRDAAEQVDDEPALQVLASDDRRVGDHFAVASDKRCVEVQGLWQSSRHRKTHERNTDFSIKDIAIKNKKNYYNIDEEDDIDEVVEKDETGLGAERHVERHHHRRVDREHQNEPVPHILEMPDVQCSIFNSLAQFIIT